MAKTKKQSCYLYLRVFTEMQVEGYSPEACDFVLNSRYIQTELSKALDSIRPSL